MLRYSNELEPGATIEYLEFEIQNTPDGLVLSKKNYNWQTEGWKCHLGNYSTIKDAKHAAIVYWMISRPEVFGTAIFYRIMGRGGTMYDFYSLKESIEKAGYALPPEIMPIDGINSLIGFDGCSLGSYWQNKSKLNKA